VTAFRVSGRRPPEWNSDVEAEGSDFAVMPELRKIDRVQFDAAHVVGNERDHADERYAAVVGRAVDGGEGAADPPALAELELIAERCKLRPVPPRILVRAGLDKGDAPRVIDQPVVSSEPGVEFVVQVLAVNGRAIGMVREPVHVEIERIEIESGVRRTRLLRGNAGCVAAGVGGHCVRSGS